MCLLTLHHEYKSIFLCNLNRQGQVFLASFRIWYLAEQLTNIVLRLSPPQNLNILTKTSNTTPNIKIRVIRLIVRPRELAVVAFISLLLLAGLCFKPQFYSLLDSAKARLASPTSSNCRGPPGAPSISLTVRPSDYTLYTAVGNFKVPPSFTFNICPHNAGKLVDALLSLNVGELHRLQKIMAGKNKGIDNWVVHDLGKDKKGNWMAILGSVKKVEKKLDFNEQTVSDQVHDDSEGGSHEKTEAGEDGGSGKNQDEEKHDNKGTGGCKCSPNGKSQWKRGFLWWLFIATLFDSRWMMWAWVWMNLNGI